MQARQVGLLGIVIWNVVALCGLVNAEGQVCYDDGYGGENCYSQEEPWSSPTRPCPPPLSPSVVGTRFFLFNRDNPDKGYEILTRPTFDLNGAPYDGSKPTAIVIHGYARDGNDARIVALKNAYLKRVDANVVITDWGPGASSLNYYQAVSNARVVGVEIGRLAKGLDVDPGNLHIVGHSLGAQTASYAANNIKGTYRITGLEPAQPGFEGFDPIVHLDKDDASFVHVVHTDARPFVGFGYVAPCGDVDHYVNGGFAQPGCPLVIEKPDVVTIKDLADVPVNVTYEVVFCDHLRALNYYTESLANLDSCIFWGYNATYNNELKAVENSVTEGLATGVTAFSPDCSKSKCSPMSIESIDSPLLGVFLVTTNPCSPFCVSHPSIGVKCDDNSN